MPDGEAPGFGWYEKLASLKGGVHLTERSYSHDPLRAWEILLGLKPKLVGELREKRTKLETARLAAEKTQNELMNRGGIA